MATEPIDPDRLPDELVRHAEPVQDARELPSVEVSTILDAEDIERIQQHAAALDVDMETLLRTACPRGARARRSGGRGRAAAAALGAAAQARLTVSGPVRFFAPAQGAQVVR